MFFVDSLDTFFICFDKNDRSQHFCLVKTSLVSIVVSMNPESEIFLLTGNNLNITILYNLTCFNVTFN